MNKEDKQRVIGKVVAINSDRFTVELLGGIDNFNVNGFDDIHYFAQLNSYVIIPYQNYYIVAEVAGVREKDLNVPFSNPTDQILSKVKSGKYLEVLPIGTLRTKKDGQHTSFDFGVSVYPALYTDTLYIKESELDAIFNVRDQEEKVCAKPRAHKTTPCNCTTKRYKTLTIGKSTIFPDYAVKVDIDKFFGSHTAILGNTGSGKSCTISAMLQELYRFNNYSATGSTFILLDVNGEYSQAFSQLSVINPDISVYEYTLDERSEDEVELFKLPHWFLNIDEWALLLQATEKTQLPILRNTLGLATIFSSEEDVSEIKNHILATCIMQILRDETGSASKKDRITSILKKFHTDEINLGRSFSMFLEDGTEVSTVAIDRGINLPCNITNCLHVHFGEIKGLQHLYYFFEQKDDDGNPVFIADKFKMPVYEKYQKFSFGTLEDAMDLAILYEEAHGNRQIRDYCSSLITRLKSLMDRDDYNFLKEDEGSIAIFKRRMLGLTKKKDQPRKKSNQIMILDLSTVEDEIVEVISCVLSRIIYETVKEFDPRNSFPINLILEEAHRYIGNDPQRSFLKANKIFEAIAKEGRKFGLFLTISSQRPSELSETVLSQCSNFIVHRIQNPADLSHIRQITPHISDTILRRLPSIPTQHALIFGQSVNLPTTFKVSQANPKPKSDNNQVSKNWFKKKDFEV